MKKFGNSKNNLFFLWKKLKILHKYCPTLFGRLLVSNSDLTPKSKIKLLETYQI